MTEPKTLTPQEALRALSEGKKLRKHFWSYKYVSFTDGGDLVDQDGERLHLHTIDFSGFTLYTEPKPKVVWVEYLCIGKVFSHTTWFKEDPVDSDYHPTGRKIEV